MKNYKLAILAVVVPLCICSAADATYVGNDPANATDPTGKTAITCTVNQTAGRASCTVSGDDKKPETTVTYHIQQFTKDKNGEWHKSEQTKTVTYAPDALGVGNAVKSQVNSYLGVKSSFAEKVAGVLAAGATVVPLQTGGNVMGEQAAKALGFSNRREAGRALEAMKKDNAIANNHQGKIMSNGDYVDAHTGEVLGNILDYKPGN